MEAGALVAYCRGGFEGEAAADLRRIAAQAGTALDIAIVPGSAHVIARAAHLDPERWDRAEAATPPIFARSIVCGAGPFPLLPPPPVPARADRITPLLAAIDALARTPFHAPPWRTAWIEFPDSNDGKALSPLARALCRADRRRTAVARPARRARGPPPARVPARRRPRLGRHRERAARRMAARHSTPADAGRRAVALDAEAGRGVRDVPGRPRAGAAAPGPARGRSRGRARRLDVAARAARRCA